jgi:arylsulfatase
MFTHRAIWHDGWKAVSFHQRGNTYDQDAWELFNLDEDFSECNDLAAKHPEKLKDLVSRWWAEAGRFGVLPLDDRGFPERAVKYQSHGSPRLRTRLVLYPGMSRIPSGAAPLVINRSFHITARLADVASAPEGVVVSLGDLSGGFTMYVKSGRLFFEYNHEGTPYRIESVAGAVTAGARTLDFEFERTADYQGVGRLFVDGRKVGEGAIPRTARWFISWSSLDVGRDSLSRVSDAYTDEFAFTPCALQRVEIELEPMQNPVDHQPMD